MMKGGNAQEFVDALSLGQEMEFSFQGRILFAQGGISDGIWTMTVDQWEPLIEDYVWETQAPTMGECFQAFLNAPIFDGMTFWEAESQMEWIAG